MCYSRLNSIREILILKSLKLPIQLCKKELTFYPVVSEKFNKLWKATYWIEHCMYFEFIYTSVYVLYWNFSLSWSSLTCLKSMVSAICFSQILKFMSKINFCPDLKVSPIKIIKKIVFVYVCIRKFCLRPTLLYWIANIIVYLSRLYSKNRMGLCTLRKTMNTKEIMENNLDCIKT